MKRREFITLLGGAALAWPLAARAQPARPPRIGIPWPNPVTASGHLDAFRQGLGELGYVEGRNMTIDLTRLSGRLFSPPGSVDFTDPRR
jgi:putative tryptophan/tyrosine transport system substrate-binding protein